ncbi:dihydroxyacetone kinase subunit DhaL [Streptosporangium longisporum]|uniref:DhaL domain-containing protein n=1 Tax=Streptosporangium longisporum TaxID=46187 RepID=A0ABN3XSN5_9ACTN
MDDLLDTTAARRWIDTFVERFRSAREELTDLDRRSGDGDFGTNVDTALDRVAAALEKARPAGPGEVFGAVSRAFLHTGGTSGPLFGMWFRELSHALAGGPSAGTGALAAGVAEGTAAVRRLGGAAVGDKTMVDALVPAAEALRAAAGEGLGVAAGLRRAARAARAGAESTRGLRARRGRASYVGEAAQDVLDPGAVLVALFFEAAGTGHGPLPAPGKVIVTVAPTGGSLTREDDPAVPTQPEEIAEDVRRCHDAGAAVAALHARRADDQATCDPAIYRRINALVRERCDVVINNSTGGGVNGDMIGPVVDGQGEVVWEQRLRGLDGGAEMCTLDAMTFVACVGDREILMRTPPSRGRLLARMMRERGVKPEWEAFSPVHVAQEVTTLIAAGHDDPPYFVSLILGLDRIFQGAMPYSPRTLQSMVDLLPDGCLFSVGAAGADQHAAVTQSLLLGGHVRVGLEDNRYLPGGEPGTNVRFVENVVRIIHSLGLEPATPAEARAMLGLPSAAA